MADVSREEQFAEFAWQATKLADVAETITLIVQTAKQAVGADAAGITMLRARGALAGVAETNELVSRGDRLQHSLREGPCVQAALEAHHVMSTDLATDDRWPRWAPQVAEMGLRSVLSATLHTAGDRRLGALNLYGYQLRQFDQDDIDTARLFAAHATAALWSAVENENLRTALDTRLDIGRAQGILMQRYNLTADKADEVLKRYSQQTNTKLRTLAQDVVTHGRLRPAEEPTG